MPDLFLPRKRLVRKRAMASMISVSPRTMDTYIAQRIVPYHKIGRTVLFDPEQVIAALKKYERKAAK